MSAKTSKANALDRGALVVIRGDPRGLARLDRWLVRETDADVLVPLEEDADSVANKEGAGTHARVFFFATGVFEVVERAVLAPAPVGAGAPAHADMIDNT